VILFSQPTFENFIVGKRNKTAYHAALEVGRSPGQKYNPLFIYGGTGTGKSHLLKAIAQEIARNDPSASIYMETYRKFTELLGNVLGTDDIARFREEISHADLFLLDDVRNDKMWALVQQELLDWMDMSIHQENQIVFTSSVSLLNLVPLNEKFMSRFQRGLSVPIEGGDRKIKEAIVSLMIEEEGVEIEAEALDLLRGLPIMDVREFIGIVNRLFIDVKLEDERLTKTWLIKSLQMLMKRCDVRRFEITAEERRLSREFVVSERKEEDLFAEAETSVEFHFADHFPEKLDREKGVEEKVQVVGSPQVELDRFIDEESEDLEKETKEDRESLEVDESEGFIMEWDHELDRLLNDL
jgi:chromosomal replication initiator protein